ncbi:MAG: hypothetical protein GF364_19595 [Candidatus Lokiarchaeota archaeon]|nr:hypothetical protein [Candidatus Lokiarchaeota archaeon]
MESEKRRNKEDLKKTPIKSYLPRVLGAILLVLEITHFLFKTSFMGFNQLDLGFLNVNLLIPETFGSFVFWIIADFLTLLLIVGISYWDSRPFFKFYTILIFILIIIVNQILFVTFVTIFAWLFFMMLLLRECIFIWQQRKKRISYKFKKGRPLILCLFLMLTLVIPITTVSKYTDFDHRPYNLCYEGTDYNNRKEIYTNFSIEVDGSQAQLINISNGWELKENKFDNYIKDVEEDESDFAMLYLLRAIYLNNNTDLLSNSLMDQINETLLGARYWYTEPGDSKTIFWTENHQLAYHTSELLAGQFFKTETFTRSGMTGQQHIDYIEPILNDFLDWRGRYGFSEWHSNTYFKINIRSLLNLADFAENQTIATKAKMLLDLLCFDFANNYYREEYAVTQGRVYGETKLSTSEINPSRRDSIADAVWLLLGLGGYNNLTNTDSIAAYLITSDEYTPPPILEQIANDAKDNHEHREKSGWNVADATDLGLNVKENEADLMQVWSTAATIHETIIDETFEFIEKYNIDPVSFIGPGIPEIIKTSAFLRGITVNELASKMDELTTGIGMEKVDTYTYRTPYYQLSGAQDYHKGFAGIQEFIWQATLDLDVFVYTNAPGGFDFKGGSFIGGWMPRGGFYKNLGIIMYDHGSQIIESKIATGALSNAMNFIGGNRYNNHAYFPRWHFDSVIQKNGWTFGELDGSYIGLYCSQPTFWANNIELVALGSACCWIVELGSEAEYSSFNNFISQVSTASVTIDKLNTGFDVSYNSPSRNLVEFGWEGDLIVDGNPFDLSTDYRWDNKYAQTPYGSPVTVIQHGGSSLTLNFTDATRTYVP